MDRRIFLLTCCCGALGVVLRNSAARAQSAKPVRRVGLLRIASAASGAREEEAFRDEMRRLGLVDGRDIVIDQRSAEGRPEALPRLAAELAARDPAVIVAGGAVVASEVRKVTANTPIIVLAADMSAAGFAARFGRPGRGITGVSFLASDLDAKRLELLCEVLPRGREVLNLSDPSSPTGAGPSLAETARALGMKSHTLSARTVEEIDSALTLAMNRGVAGVNVLSSPFLNANRARIIERAAVARLPTIFQWVESAEEGGLLAYGPRISVIYRQLAGFAARIVNGRSVEELPVEQPTRFELIVNVRTASAIGIEVPPSMLVRADEVIR